MGARMVEAQTSTRSRERRAAPAQRSRQVSLRALDARIGNTGVRRPATGAVLATRARLGNRSAQRLLDARGSTLVQRKGGYIPDIDGPYGHSFSDGPSTAGAAFSAQLRNDILDENAGYVEPEMLELVHVSDEDQDTMLTRNRNAVAEVDHIYPRALGGSSSHRNAAVISAASNTWNSDGYPKELVERFDGTRVLMGHAARATGHYSGVPVVYDVPAYQDFPVTGSGANAMIDMSGYNYTVWDSGNRSATLPGPQLSPAQARTAGILPNGIPDPA
jgi:hypothetical protein